jgi:hypothetical protein
MKKFLFVILALAIVVLPSCKKTRYCKCTAIINEEVVEFSQEYFTIESNMSCADKSKEISGWPQVICYEVSEYEVTGEKPKWWEEWFGGNKN